MRFALLLALVVGATACEAEPEDEVARTEPAAETTPAEAPESPAAGTALAVETLPDGDGEYLTDQEGRTVYLLEHRDEPDACVDACADAWPPVLVEGSGQVTASGAQQDLVGTVARPDGTLQVTYDGHPLYYFARDEVAGSMLGHDMHDEWGEWYLVSPSGEALEER